MLNWVLIIALAIVVLFVIVGNVVGALLPRDHRAAARARFGQSPDKVWRTITNMPDAPNWRSGLRRVERLPDREGKEVWVEVSRFGRMPFVFEEMDPPRRLVMKTDDEKLPFGGTWTYEIAPTNGGSALTITEVGVIRKPLLRFLSRYAFGYDATMRKYLKDLGRKLGEKTAPERLEHRTPASSGSDSDTSA